MKRKTTIIIGFLALVLSLSPVITANAESGICGSSSTCELDGSGTLTISGSGKIDKKAWRGKEKSIKKLVINNGITDIDSSMFADCTNLESISFPASLVRIGFYSFKGCTALKSVTIPKGVVDSGGCCFISSGLTSVTFEDGATVVPSSFLKGCSDLTTVNFPASITTIDASAFADCVSLKTIDLPKNLVSIGFYAFQNCKSLDKITIPKTVVKSGGCCFISSGLTSVTFEDGATTVPSSLLKGCSNLTTVNFPNSIETIEGSAFADCISLKSLTLPYYLKSIGFYTFNGCNNLKDVTIYQNTKDIDGCAFINITGLKIHGKPGSEAQAYAKKKGHSFTSCKVPALKGITYKKGALKYTVITDYIDGKGTVCVTGMAKNSSSVTIPATVKLESYNYKVVQIGKNAFKKKSKLKKITIKSTNITKVGKDAFKGINKKAVFKVPKAKFNDYKKLISSKTGFAKKTMKIKK